MFQNAILDYINQKRILLQLCGTIYVEYDQKMITHCCQTKIFFKLADMDKLAHKKEQKNNNPRTMKTKIFLSFYLF